MNRTPATYKIDTEQNCGRCDSVKYQYVRWGLFKILLPCIILCICFFSDASDIYAAQNVVNNAFFEHSGVKIKESSVTVTLRNPTPPKIEFLQYSPKIPSAELVPLLQGYFKNSSDNSSSQTLLPPPKMTGSVQTIELSKPVPLTLAVQYHQGDPFFVRVTDLDMNSDPFKRETIYTVLTVPNTGDSEIVSLTETGLNTGVFVGYIPSNDLSASPYSGILQVKDESKITATYSSPSAGVTVTSAILVDPYGIVFDTTTGKPVNGVKITLIDTATNLPAHVHGDDGFSTFPSTLTTGGTATDDSGKLYTFPEGGYRFPYIVPGIYRYEIETPTDYISPSTVETTKLQQLPGAPFAIFTGSRGEQFPLNPGPAIRIDIPIDPKPAPLWVVKTSSKESVAHGEFLSYSISVQNSSHLIVSPDIRVMDMLPTGFRYQRGSAHINEAAASDPQISGDGQTLTFTLGNLSAQAVTTIQFVVEVTAGSRLGSVTNFASAISSSGVRSNVAKAVVAVKDDFLRTRSILMGRVTTGVCPENGEEPQDGLEGVRVYLEDGTFVVSDKFGLFHFEGVRPGLHVVQMDLDSLPDGYVAVPCTENSRFAGRAFSQFVEVQGGTLWRADFHAGKKPDLPARTPAIVESAKKASSSTTVQEEQIVKGVVSLEMENRPEAGEIKYVVTLHGGVVPVNGVKLTVTIPPCSTYKSDSSAIDGVAVKNPVRYMPSDMVWTLGDMPAEWNKKLTFTTIPSAACSSESMESRGYLAFTTPKGSKGLTAPAITSMEQQNSQEFNKIPDITVRPHFPSFGSALNAADRKKLDELAKLLKELNTEKIELVGHTDSVPISKRGRRIYKDNVALSFARARSVGRYLMGALHLPPEKLVIDGKGESSPVATNRTSAGKALNRRVEVRAVASRVFETSKLRAIKEISGPLEVETEGETVLVPVQQQSEGSENNKGSAVDTSASALVTSGKNIPSGFSDSTEILSKSGNATSQSTVDSTKVDSSVAEGQDTISEPEKVLPDGLLYPKDGTLLTDRINAVRIQIPSSLTPKLVLDGVEINSDRIGFRSVNQKSGKTSYSYIGVDFGEKGKHKLEAFGTDPFGNPRFSSKGVVIRTGAIATIRVLNSEGNVADGKTPVKIQVELLDIDRNILKGSGRIPLGDSSLKPYIADKNSLSLDDKTVSSSMIDVDSEGFIRFEPVYQSGSQKVILGEGLSALEIELYIKPKMRDWILVGLAEGTVGYNTASGNMESLSASELREDLYKDGRVAFYAKGQVKGEWLLTMAYDSEKTRANSKDNLFQTINPDTYYTLYGDATQQGYDAASASKIYLRIERDQFYAMFGDYDTGLSVTELSRYSRKLTGGKTEYKSKYLDITAFAAETDQGYVRDEIPGDGTSGLYRLTRKGIVPNSEKITIEVRDRFHSENIISSKTLGRFTEYSIEYDSGAIFFKEPIHSRDEKFNPIYIVVEYEVSGGQLDYTYGGKATLKLLDGKVKTGFTHVHEGEGERKGNLYGTDTVLKLGDNTILKGEYAQTDVQSPTENRKGQAYLAEISHRTKRFDGKAYYREQEGGFGLGQQSASEGGTRKIGAEAQYRLNENYSANANLYRQYTFLSSTIRDVADGKFNYSNGGYGAYVGYLHAVDRIPEGEKTSGQITTGGKASFFKDKLTLSADYAQSVIKNENSDFPTRATFGAELKVLRNLSLLAAQEFTWSKTATTTMTRVGAKSTPWSGGTISTSIERQLNENEQRVMANVGLKQTWQVSETWKVDVGLDRSQTVLHQTRYQVNANVPPASGGGEDFTAVTAGGTYQIKGVVWENRAETRFSKSEDKWGVLIGIVQEISRKWGWSGKMQIMQTYAFTGIDTTRANLRYGLVFRPPQTKWILLNRLDLYLDKQTGEGSGDTTSWRFVNNLSANYRPHKKLQVSLKYGAKFVTENIYGRSYSAFTDHIGMEGRYDITKEWDIGMRASLLHSWHGGQYAYSFGPSIGYNMIENVWLGLGYNVWGFTDKDFSAADYTAQGPYMRFRMKFDQKSVKDAAGWLNKE